MAYVPDPKPARNELKFEVELTPPSTFGANRPFCPGSNEAPGKFPGRNVLTKLKALKTLALGSIVTRSRILIGHDTLKSIVFNHGIPSALGATESTVGITQPRATISVGSITAGPDISPVHLKWLLAGTLFATRHAPAGVKFAP